MKNLAILLDERVSVLDFPLGQVGDLEVGAIPLLVALASVEQAPAWDSSFLLSVNSIIRSLVSNLVGFAKEAVSTAYYHSSFVDSLLSGRSGLQKPDPNIDSQKLPKLRLRENSTSRRNEL